MILPGAVTFDPDFASTPEWATAYRSFGLQVVPARHPSLGKDWKIPALAWKEFQENLVPDALFERWYGPNGEHAKRVNMGLITGRASGNVFIIDLDTYKSPAAMSWWRGVLAEHNNDMEPETAQQVTGGGGRQMLFRGAPGWEAPTNRTKINVDIRGQGGFAVLPPSVHDSGKNYVWKVGCAPWEMSILDAPQWLMDAVDKLVLEHGGDKERQSSEHIERTASPSSDFNPFGAQIDGREEKMRDMVWASVVDWYRECPLPPSREASEARMRETYATYERITKTRLEGPESNATRLEKEGRGHTLFADKWRRAMEQWDTDIAIDAAKPRPGQLMVVNDAPKLDASGAPLPLLLSAAQFIAGFRPPEYLIDGIIQRSYLYSLTARTGHGKTAIDMYMSQAVARGQTFHGKQTKQGSVLFLAGENPDDVRARFLVLADHHGFDPATIPFYFIDGVIDIAASLPRIRAEAEKIGDITLVSVDTAAAYYRGDDGNNNSQQGEYARMLRQLTFLPGKPAVLVNCHPVKNAARDNLLPVGGGAFLNEVDGNLTLWSNSEKQTTLHWQGKFRGPEFEPMAFEMRTVESEKVVDSNGVLMPSVVAVPISEMAIERGEQGQEDDENLVLKIIAANPRASFAAIAKTANWLTSDGKPQKSKVGRVVERLKADKLLETRRGSKMKLTKKGEKEIGIEKDDH